MEARQTKARPLVLVVVLLLSSSFLVLAVAGARIAYAQSTSVTVVCSPAGSPTDPLPEGTQAKCTATVTGQSTPGPTGNVVWGTGLGANNQAPFSSPTCALSGGVCSVTYTVPSCPPACNSVVIYGTYQGDPKNLASTGTFTLFVSSSSSTSSSSSSSSSSTSSSSSSSTGSSPLSVSLTVPSVKVDYGWPAHFKAVVGNVPSGSTYTIAWSAGPGTPACGTPSLQTSSSDKFNTTPLTPSQTPSIVMFCASLNAGPLGTALANATAIVYPALVGPVISVSPPTVDVGQTATLTTTTPFSGGTPPYTCQWVERNPELGRFIIYGNAFNCAATSSPTVSIGNLSAAGTLLFELQVTDNASQPMTVASPNANITVALPPTTISIGITTNDDLFWIILFGVVILGIAVAVIIGLYILGFIGGDEDGDEPPQQEEIIHPPQQEEIIHPPQQDTAPPEEPPVPPTPAPSVPVSPPAAAPTTAPPLEPSPPKPAAPDPDCTRAKKAYDDALNEFHRLVREGLPTADADRAEREARNNYIECLKAHNPGGDFSDPAFSIMPLPPRPTIPPAAQPSPVGVNPTAPPTTKEETNPPPTPPAATGPTAGTSPPPVLVPLPTKEKPKPECNEGETKLLGNCECTVNLALTSEVIIEYGSAHPASKEAVDDAIKGAVDFLTAVDVGSKLAAMAGGGIPAVANLAVSGSNASGEGGGAIDAVKALNDKLEKLKGTEKKIMYDITVTFPVVRYLFSCRSTGQCQGGRWVVSHTSKLEYLGPATPNSISFSPTGTSVKSVQQAIETKAAIFNSAANTAIGNCLKKCQ